MSEVLLKTPLYDWHKKHEAKTAGFAGWDMPIQYADGIIAEHNHTREHVGIFDICHMGEIMMEGKGATEALAKAFSANLDTLEVGRCRYGFLLTEEGGIIDDLIIYRLADEKYLAVVNAGCRQIDFEKFSERMPGIKVTDISDDIGKIDVQGPESLEVLEKLMPEIEWKMPYFGFVETKYKGQDVLVSRTGYTGELGYELYLPVDLTLEVWELLMTDKRVAPVGLGARDTLRLEMGLPLNGQDVGPDYSPAEAGYSFMLTNEADYVGKAGSTQIRRKLIPLSIDGRRPARHGNPVENADGKEVGVVSSGSFAPSLGHCIAFAYIDKDKADDDKYFIPARRTPIEAKVVDIPFYKNGTARKKL